MTKREAESLFRSTVLPVLRDNERDQSNGRVDKGARRFAWDVFTDSLCKDGKITQAQYANWHAPRFLEAKCHC